MKKVTLISLLSVMFLAVAVAFGAGGTTFYIEDESPALRAHNTGTEVVTIVLAAGDDSANYALVGSVSNDLDWSGGAADIIGEIGPLLAAVTNAAGTRVLTVDTDCSLSADSSDDELLDTVTTVLAPGEWDTVAKWDTSDSGCYFFSCYSPGERKAAGGMGQIRTLRKIYGNIGGTGNITVNIYLDGVEVYEKVFVSPVEVFPHSMNYTGTVTMTADETTPGQLDIDLNFPIGGSQNCMIRATRATTATTGSIGAIIE